MGKDSPTRGRLPVPSGCRGSYRRRLAHFLRNRWPRDLARKLHFSRHVPLRHRTIPTVSTRDLLRRFRSAEAALLNDARHQRARWGYRVNRGRVRFDHEAREAQRRLKQGLLAFLRESSVGNALTAPLIYSLAVPLALADIWITTYQWLCFPIYGIGRVRRRDYFVVDRHKLGYLNAIEKVNCSYATGLIAYIREIAARTEQYWCPIKHGRRVRSPHPTNPLFADYGDAAGYRERGPELREALSRRRQPRVSGARKRIG